MKLGMTGKTEITLEVPNEILLGTRGGVVEFETYAKKELALLLYRDKGISLGYCAQFADMTKEDFIMWLGKNGVSIFDFEDEEDFVRECANA